jgi:hypothetical protein
MATRSLTKFVKRYTTLSSALDTLANRNLTLLSPNKWDDTNDIYFMELYATEAKIGSLLAMCCTMATETYHHWKCFTQGIEGVCIEIDRNSIELALINKKQIRTGQVDYLRVLELERLGSESLSKLPFVKREGYSDEREWRIIAECPLKAEHTFQIEIELAWINRIVINPWMPPTLVSNLRNIIREIPGCGSLKIESSHLTNSQRWKKAGKALCGNQL